MAIKNSVIPEYFVKRNDNYLSSIGRPKKKKRILKRIRTPKGYKYEYR